MYLLVQDVVRRRKLYQSWLCWLVNVDPNFNINIRGRHIKRERERETEREREREREKLRIAAWCSHYIGVITLWASSV